MPITVTEMGDQINAIRNALYQAFVDRTAAGQWFDGFFIEKYRDVLKGYVVPGISLELLPSPSAIYGLGEHREWRATFQVNLIFKDNHGKDIGGGTTYYKDEAAEWYLMRILDVLEETSFGSGVTETSRSVTGTVHQEPMEGSNIWLWGCIAEVAVAYVGGVA